MKNKTIQLNGDSLLRDGSKPLYLQVQELLRTYVSTPGALYAGRLPTEQELAAMLGVSRSTVSQALALLADENLICRVKHRGTVITAALDRFDPQAHKLSIGLVFPISQGWRQAIAVMEKQAVSEGYHFELYSYRWEDADDEQRSFERARRNCAGIVLYPNGLGTDLEFIRRIVNDKIPFVLFDLYYENLDCNIVSSANFLSMYQLTEKLLERGYRRPGLLARNRHLITVRRRLDGWRQALADHGIEPKPEWILEDTPETPLESVKKWVRANRLDAMAATLSDIGEKGSLLPLAVCDMPCHEHTLFTARQNEDELGASAIELLTAAIRHPGRNCRRIFASPIITE